ncbi:DNA replication regulator Sld3 [Penicillium taxi]|uniref:DNA replication regulator Sld3 n=1 Tax=Penicillium taxi TaxID=168475 RepID=UPI0025455411|nr:DNA replication regulator Sld3 [Penicillium taxi]KAJ5894001.1 DNA replication regulator Sld3 [Penicillium taxi]
MTARIVPSALDSIRSSTLDTIHDATQPPAKKRKIEPETAAGQLSTTSIVIRAHARTLSDVPLVLDPITAFPRSRLLLSWLDDAPWLHSDSHPDGLFAVNLPSLETDFLIYAEPTVLLVRLVATGGLYVIERVKRGIYSLCRLARGVHEGDILAAAKGWQGLRVTEIHTEIDEKPSQAFDTDNWWQAARIAEPSSDLGLGEELAGLQVAVVFKGPEPGIGHDSHIGDVSDQNQSVAPATGYVDTKVDESQGSKTMHVDGVSVFHELEAQQLPDELFNGMRDHYLQALYVSNTSVAYFAKGPLARCRTAFQTTDQEQSPSLAALIEFYRESILPAKKMDLKYRETVPTCIRDAILAVSDDEGAPGATKRKSKKKKLGKNGVYPEEESFIRKWWKDRSMLEASSNETSRETETKKHISDLRLRETQLQILLILETIALEFTQADGKSTGVDEKSADGGKQTPKKPKAKKLQDLNILLELHLDRMCIWHAVSSMEDTSAADSAKTSSFTEGHMSGKKVESDAVRDFCTEVIIPFFGARLPDKCRLVSRKFGVSTGTTPTSKSRTLVEPGKESKRQPPQKIRRTLQRVLTDERAAAASHNRQPSNRQPSLSRSNTVPAKTENRRRTSIDPQLPGLVSGTIRGGIQKAKGVENREVDLKAVARQHESKLRKVQLLADQKKELDAAIMTLRKPNRQLVAQDIATDASKRVVSTGGSSSRKPKNPVRNPYGQGVQVMATPRGNRKKDVVAGLPPLPRSLVSSRSFAGETEYNSLAESPVMIPSSSRRAISFSGADSNPFSSGGVASRKRARQEPSTELEPIQETPTRPASKMLFGSSNADDEIIPRRLSLSSSKGKGLFRVPNIPAPRDTDPFIQPMAPSTPVSSRHKTISTSTPTQPSSKSFQTAMIMETPPKQRASNPTSAAHITSIIPASPGNQPPAKAPAIIRTPVKGTATIAMTPEQPDSVYAQLGWDDDDVDVDL